MKYYCETCNKFDVDYTVVEEKQHINVKGVFVDVDVLVPRCNHCHKPLYISEIEKENDIKIYDAYKEKVGLLTSKQIKDIRLKRNLSQVAMAKLLCLGEKDIARYENGRAQSASIDLLIRIFADDESYEKFFKKDKDKSK